MQSSTSRRARRPGLRILTGLAAVAAAALCQGGALAQEPMPSQEEMWRIIQMQAAALEQQRQEIDALNRSLGLVQASQEQAEVEVAEAQRAAEEAQATASEAQLAALETAPFLLADTGIESGDGGWWDRTSLGGYGELHYEGGAKDEIDFHRFVLFLGHEFNDDIRFFSELELEHALAGEGQPGEIELEQAYLQFDLTDRQRINAGLQLLPLGILNETHEPPTFFGVERNPIESNIIPSTWWEAGVGLNGNLGESGLSYDIMASSGLNVPTTGSNAFRVRSGRQKVAQASAKAPAVTGRLRYTGLPGLELAASGHYQSDITQGAGDPISGDDVPALLLSAHADARFGGFGMRALYASWWIDGMGADAIGRDRQKGFYLEPSYRFALNRIGLSDSPGELGLFYRYGWWDTNAGMSALGLESDQHALGVNYWPHPDVVFKFDYLREQSGGGAGTDRINAGLGFQF